MVKMIFLMRNGSCLEVKSTLPIPLAENITNRTISRVQQIKASHIFSIILTVLVTAVELSYKSLQWNLHMSTS